MNKKIKKNNSKITDNTKINIDTNEIKKFDNLSYLWWDKQGPLKSLHIINQLRLNYIINQSKGLFDKTVLDIGSGGGILTESMAKEGAKITGIDVSINAIMIAKQHALKKNLNINYIHQTIEEHSKNCLKKNFYYDIVTCMEVLEHVPNPKSIVLACSKIVKKNGDVFFSTINRNFKSWIFAIKIAENILNIIPTGTHNFKNFIKPSELLKWIDHTTLKEQDIIGINYNPFKKSYLSKNIQINYILHTKYTKY